MKGVGWSTTEELIWGDEEHKWVKPRGRLFTQGPGFYKPPAFNDMPSEFNVTLMDGVANKFAVMSSKAIGGELTTLELGQKLRLTLFVHRRATVWNGRVRLLRNQERVGRSTKGTRS